MGRIIHAHALAGYVTTILIEIIDIWIPGINEIYRTNGILNIEYKKKIDAYFKRFNNFLCLLDTFYFSSSFTLQ